jgi:hypothetical protein
VKDSFRREVTFGCVRRRFDNEKRFDKIESALLTNGGNKPERSLVLKERAL